MASANSGSSFKVITPLCDSYDTTLSKAQVSAQATYFEAGIDSLLKPCRMTAGESFVDLPALLTKGQGEIRQVTSE
jgi:hypothetical protein